MVEILFFLQRWCFQAAICHLAFIYCPQLLLKPTDRSLPRPGELSAEQKKELAETSLPRPRLPPPWLLRQGLGGISFPVTAFRLDSGVARGALGSREIHPWDVWTCQGS